MNKAEIREFLDLKYLEFNRPDFIGTDPICIPHRYHKKEDIEIAGLFAAIIAWGRRDMIIRSGLDLMQRMGEEPYRFVMECSDSEIEDLQGFVYRTFQWLDLKYILLGLRRIYQDLGGLEQVMAASPGASDTMGSILALRSAISSVEGFPQRTFKHLANPAKGSSAKRLNMFLRWMVRKDKSGVDFGLWNSLNSSQLICPLDVHTGNVGRKLGLLRRKQNDWKAALELTAFLRELDSADPVKYDFSLFGLGVFEGF